MSLEQLQSRGWYFTTEGFNVISNNGSIKNCTHLIEKALSTDVKEFMSSILTSELKKEKTSQIVLQIQKIRNISAPRAKEESQAAPRMLKLTLTDGHSYCQAIEVSPISSLSRTGTCPGSKLFLNGARVVSGCLLITPQCCTLLGGIVPTLHEKWEIVKGISDHVRSAGRTDGAPKWVNFGQQILSTDQESFKSLKTPETNETSNEFDLMRKGAISNVSTGAVRKVFGGGGKGADKTNQMRDKTREPRNQRTRRENKEKQTEKPLKPPEKVSLFDFLENKLTIDESNAKTDSIPFNQTQTHYTKQYSSKSAQNYRNQGNRFPPRNSNQTQINDLTNSVGKLSVADNSRGTYNTNRSEEGGWEWKIGEFCMAKYWEDNKFYNAQVINLTDRTCVVRFSGHGNVEEVLKTDCIPFTHTEEEFGYNNRRPPFNRENQERTTILEILNEMPRPPNLNFPLQVLTGSVGVWHQRAPHVQNKNFKILPIQQKRIITFINHFVIDTVSLLNNFAQSCESRLMDFEYKVQKVEASLLILESQLASIPNLDGGEVQLVEEKAEPVELELPPVNQDQETETNNEETIADPAYSRFFKMLQVGVPLAAVQHKMELEGLDPSVLK